MSFKIFDIGSLVYNLISKIPGIRNLSSDTRILITLFLTSIGLGALAFGISSLTGIAIGTIALASFALISATYTIHLLYKKGKSSLITRKQNLDKKIIENQIHKNVCPLPKKDRDALFNNTFNDSHYLSTPHRIDVIHISFPKEIPIEQAIARLFAPLSSEQKIALLKKPMGDNRDYGLFRHLCYGSYSSIFLLKALFKDLSEKQRTDLLRLEFDCYSLVRANQIKSLLEVLFEGLPIETVGPLFKDLSESIRICKVGGSNEQSREAEIFLINFLVKKGILEMQPDLIESFIQNPNIDITPYRNRLKSTLNANIKEFKQSKLDPIEELVCDYLVGETFKPTTRPI